MHHVHRYSTGTDRVPLPVCQVGSRDVQGRASYWKVRSKASYAVYRQVETLCMSKTVTFFRIQMTEKKQKQQIYNCNFTVTSHSVSGL